MKRNLPPIILTGCAVFMAALLHAADWPQLQNTPQRTGYSAENLDLPFSNTWVHSFAPDRMAPQAQPVIAGGRVYIGTERGVFYQFDAATGAVLKMFTVPSGASILHTAAVSATNGLVFFGCMDGKVYALRTADLSQAWVFDSGKSTGFSIAVLLVEPPLEASARIYIANRDGTVYCLDMNGNQLWSREIRDPSTNLRVPVLMSFCYDKGPDGIGRVFVPAMNMTLYALQAADGSVSWQQTVRGATFKDYSPVAWRGKVFVRPMMADSNDNYINYRGVVLTASNTLTDAEIAQQDIMVSDIQSQPRMKEFYVFDQTTGNEPYIVPQWAYAMHGGVLPPVVDGDGMLIAPATVQDWHFGWGRLKLDYVDPSDGQMKPRVVERLWDGVYWPNPGSPTGAGNGDENMLASAAGRLVFVMHTKEGYNAQYSGVWHLDRKQWTPFDRYAPDASFSSNTQGNGGNAPAISNGMMFHNTCYTNLNARTFTKVP